MCRKNGRSYLGILETVESTLSTLDFLLTDINNIVKTQQTPVPAVEFFHIGYENNSIISTSCADVFGSILIC